jgi:hypothetical protein
MTWRTLGRCRDLAAQAAFPRVTVTRIHGALVLAVLLVGCDRERCELGESRCRDNVAEVCGYSDSGEEPGVWTREDCGSAVCLEGVGAEAFCALHDSPDPRCSERPSRPICDEQQQVSCRQGYATAITDCAATAGYCVEAGDGGLCVTDARPSEHCPADSYATACEGDTLLTCSYGYTRSREPCTNGEQCVVTPGFAMCSPSAELDPSCPPAAAMAHVCDDDAVVECIYGYGTRIFRCAVGEICQQAGTPEFPEAFCARAE